MPVAVDFYGRELLGDAFALPTAAERALENVFSQILRKHHGVLAASLTVVEVSINLISSEEMAELNAAYRGVSDPTDVLSFPLWEEGQTFVPPEGWKELPLGDIVVCDEVVARHAGEHGVMVVEELALVLVHGFLHLLGWDHDTPEKEGAMWREQAEHVRCLLRQWGVPAPTNEEVEVKRER